MWSSASVGCLAGLFAAAERLGGTPATPPDTTAMGALLAHITGGHISREDEGPRSFQPMNVNFGLFPAVDAPKTNEDGKRLKGQDKKKARNLALSRRALADFDRWIASQTPIADAAE